MSVTASVLQRQGRTVGLPPPSFGGAVTGTFVACTTAELAQMSSAQLVTLFNSTLATKDGNQ